MSIVGLALFHSVLRLHLSQTLFFFLVASRNTRYFICCVSAVLAFCSYTALVSSSQESMAELKMNDTELPSPKVYQGNCHCGQIRFDLDLHQPLRHVFTCHCLMCSKKGYLWIFPEKSQFRITSGQQVMASYAENGRSGEHFVSYLQSPLDHSSLTS